MRKQTKIHTGLCDHDVTEPVKNGFDVTIAWRCSSCTFITAHQGKCDGTCGKTDVKLTKHIAGVSPRRYCTEACYSESMKAKRKAADEAARIAADKKPASKVSYMHGQKP